MNLSKVIRILPVDDRPCHNDHILLAMEQADSVEVQLAPQSILGHFTHSGNTDAMASFLSNKLEDVDTLIVSLDALCYGGLIQGRTHSNEPMESYLNKLDVIKEIKSKHPHLKIYAYSVIMRLTTTVTDSSKLQEWEDLFTYSQLVNKVKNFPEVQEALDEVIGRLPQITLDNYLMTRERNHSINKKMVELVRDGIIDYGVLVQEDTSEFGLHLEEQGKLNKLISEYELHDRLIMKNGTDEMVALLVAKTISRQSSIKLERSLLSDTFVAPYEDHTLIENLMKSLAIGGVSIDDNSSNTLCVIAPLTRSYDLAFEPVDDSNLLETINFKPNFDASTKNVYVLDVAYANGGDIRNLEYILKDKDITLKGYSAWNTASNAIGSLVLDIVIAQEFKLNKDYLKLRIIDDALYQGMVRGELNKRLVEQGQDIWGEVYSPEANDWLSNRLNELAETHVLTSGLKVSASLPWGRTFELRMEKI